jgi:alpha-glucosidase
MFGSLFFVTSILGALLRGSQAATPLQSCPGYKASSVQHDENSLTADLSLAGDPCNTYGTDLGNLKLKVDYETGT